MYVGQKNYFPISVSIISSCTGRLSSRNCVASPPLSRCGSNNSGKIRDKYLPRLSHHHQGNILAVRLNRQQLGGVKAVWKYMSELVNYADSGHTRVLWVLWGQPTGARNLRLLCGGGGARGTPVGDRAVRCTGPWWHQGRAVLQGYSSIHVHLFSDVSDENNGESKLATVVWPFFLRTCRLGILEIFIQASSL